MKRINSFNGSGRRSSRVNNEAPRSPAKAGRGFLAKPNERQAPPEDQDLVRTYEVRNRR